MSVTQHSWPVSLFQMIVVVMIHWSRKMLKVKDGQLACCYETFLIMKSCYSRDKQVFTLIYFKVPNLHSTQSQFIWNRFGIFLPVNIFKHKLWFRLKNTLNFHSILIFQITKQTVDATNENNGYFFISPAYVSLQSLFVTQISTWTT